MLPKLSFPLGVLRLANRAPNQVVRQRIVGTQIVSPRGVIGSVHGAVVVVVPGRTSRATDEFQHQRAAHLREIKRATV